MANIKRTSDMATATVMAIRNTSPVSSDSLESSIATRVTTHTERCGSGIRSVMQRMSTTVHATTTRTVAMARPGNGASSLRRKWRSGMRSSHARSSSGDDTISAGMALRGTSVGRPEDAVAEPASDDRDRGGADPAEVRGVGVVDADTYG